MSAEQTVETVDNVEKRAAMEQVLQSATFVRANQVRNFLRYICEMELAGRASALHEYLIAVEAMGLPSSVLDRRRLERPPTGLRAAAEAAERLRQRADAGQSPDRSAEGQLRTEVRAGTNAQRLSPPSSRAPRDVAYLNRRGSIP